MPTILLVDDDPSVSRVIQDHLTLAGHAVITEPDTASALTELGRLAPFDLMIVDLVMPAGQPDGLDFANTVLRRMPEVPVIFITGYYGFVARSGQLPGPVLYKPLDLPALSREIDARLEG